MVQYLPMPVVGGYLAFIGLYCFEAGLALMTGETIDGLADWHKIFTKDNGILLAPGVLGGGLLLMVLQRFRHFAVLPCCLVSIPVIFYIILAAGSYSLEDARLAYGRGWVENKTKGAEDFWDGWELYDFNHIQWYVIPAQIPTWIAMYFVVAFSSSLDVAAIQMELGKPLNFNHELQTVGISNISSGLTGGFTGSYIFSQTIFTMRAGVSHAQDQHRIMKHQTEMGDVLEWRSRRLLACACSPIGCACVRREANEALNRPAPPPARKYDETRTAFGRCGRG